MSVTLTKVVKKTPTPLVVKHDEVEVLEPDKLTIEDLADQYGRLTDIISSIQANPAFAQFKIVVEELKKRLAEFEPEEIVKIIGKHWVVEAGACAKEQRRVIDAMQVMEFVGTETFAQLAKVNFGDAEKYLTPDQLEKVVNKPGFTTNRTIKVQYLGGGKK